MHTINASDIVKYQDIQKMCNMAWKVRKNAFISPTGKTKVGAVVYNKDEESMFPGCNIQHRYRTPDVHAEANAISTLVASGLKTFHIILVVAEREKFTPCGGCMDWIMEIGGPTTQVMFQGELNGNICVYTAEELMPHYPK